MAWLSLDAGDNDPARFWRYVAAPYVASFAVDTSMRVANAKAKAELGLAPGVPNLPRRHRGHGLRLAPAPEGPR